MNQMSYEGLAPETMDEANKRLDGILRGNIGASVQPFNFIDVPAAVQEAGDKAWAQSARHVPPMSMAELAASEGIVSPKDLPVSPSWKGVAKRAPRSDKGKPRPKPQPAPEPEQKTGGITREQAKQLQSLVDEQVYARNAFVAIANSLDEAAQRRDKSIDDLNAFIDSLAK